MIAPYLAGTVNLATMNEMAKITDHMARGLKWILFRF